MASSGSAIGNSATKMTASTSLCQQMNTVTELAGKVANLAVTVADRVLGPQPTDPSSTGESPDPSGILPAAEAGARYQARRLRDAVNSLERLLNELS
jgi:hypothetical protein